MLTAKEKKGGGNFRWIPPLSVYRLSLSMVLVSMDPSDRVWQKYICVILAFLNPDFNENYTINYTKLHSDYK